MRDGGILRFRSAKKRKQKDTTIVQLGVEIETCIDSDQWSEYQLYSEDRIGTIGVLKAVEDESIRCDVDGTIPLEFVSNPPIDFHVNESNEEQSDQYREMLSNIDSLFSMSSPCALDRCGTHVHMSLPNQSVNEHPFLFAVIQSEWIKHYQKRSIETFKTRPSSNYSVCQEIVLGRAQLTKYTDLNMLPTFTEKRSGEYSERSEKELVYHVEFRGQDDAHIAFHRQHRTRAGGVFDKNRFTEYVNFLATFLTHCANLPDISYQLDSVDLSLLRLSRASHRLRRDLRYSGVTTVDLSKNNFDGESLKAILEAAAQSSTLRVLNIGGNKEDVIWEEDSLMQTLQNVLPNLDVCAIGGTGRWRDHRNRQVIIESALQSKTSLVVKPTVELGDLTYGTYNQTAVNAPGMALRFYARMHSDSEDILKQAASTLQKGTKVETIYIYDGIRGDDVKTMPTIFPALKHHTIREATLHYAT